MIGDLIEILCLIMVILAIILFGVLIPKEIEKQKWVIKHCLIINEIPGEPATGISSNGDFVFTWTDDRTEYKCDNGQQFWK